MSAIARELAIRHLEQWLGLDGASRLPMFLHQAANLCRGLTELQVLTSAEEADWNARFARAVRPIVRADQATRGRARELLERELAADNERTDDPRERRRRFTDKLHALRVVGALDAQEAHNWRERLDEAIPPPRQSSPPPLFKASELRAVALGPTERLGGLRITSAELFEDSTMIRWHLVIDEDPGWREHIFPSDHACDLAQGRGPTALTDDLGTRYAPTPISSMFDLDWLRLKQTPEVLPGVSVFVPHAPSAATELQVASPAGRFAIDLRNAA